MRLKKNLLIVASFFFFPLLGYSQNANKLEIIYTGNMGVLISDGKQSLAIDAFHVFYKKDYLNPSPELVDKLMEGKFEGYPAVEMALFTHVHGDHYYKGYGAEFIEKADNNWLVAARQSCEEARELLGEKGSKQIKEVPYDHSAFRLKKGNIEVKAFRLDHANPSRHSETQNIAFILSMGGCKSLHVGDTEWDAVEEIFPRHKVLEEKIDVAILPYWMLLYDDPVEHVKQYINPAKIIATHIPPDLSKADANKMRRLFPEIVLFQEIGKEYLMFKKLDLKS